MKLKVLIYLNTSVIGFSYIQQQIASLPNDWSITVLTPSDFYSNLFSRDVEKVEYNYASNAEGNRYNFDYNKISSLPPYDLVINHQPEITANLKSALFNERGGKPLIINYFHWIDCKESTESELNGAAWRQIEGINMADLSLFHSWYGIKLMDQSRNAYGLSWVDKQPLISTFTPAPTIYGQQAITLVPDNKKIILFNHKLNDRTGWEEVVKNLTEIRKQRDDFVLWIADDMKFDEPWIIAKKPHYETYGYLYKNSHFSITNTKGFTIWDQDVVDSLQNGCVPLAPHNEFYSSILGSDFIQHGSVSKYGNMTECINGLLDLPKDKVNVWIEQAEIKHDTDIVKWVEEVLSKP